MRHLLALLLVGTVAFVYTYARLARRAWPSGHPWSGLALLLLSAGVLLQGNAATAAPSVYAGSCFVLAILSAIVWLVGTRRKPRGHRHSA